MREDAGHGGTGVQMVDHVLDEGEIRFGLGCQLAIGTEAVVIFKDGTG